MKIYLVALLLLFVGCSSNIPKKECEEGALGYSHIFNPLEVERAAIRCNYAYMIDDSIKDYYMPTNVFIKTIKETDIKYFIYYDHLLSRQHITIRGTASLKNAMTDGQYRKVYNEKLGIWVHKGFNEAAMSVYKDIVNSNRLEKKYLTTITGHSLGGAVAGIVYLMLYEDGLNLGMTYTFGQPMFTNKKGLRKYRCVNLLRFVNEKDMVPHVPPTHYALGLLASIALWRHGTYRHIGDEVLLLKDSNYVYLEYHYAEGVKINSFWRNVLRKEVSLEDHHMPAYLKSLKNKNNVITEQKFKNRNKYE